MDGAEIARRTQVSVPSRMMKLYRSTKYSSWWFAFSPAVGWVMFPAEIDGWQKCQAAGRVDLLDMQEVPLSLGFNTGIPTGSEKVSI